MDPKAGHWGGYCTCPSGHSYPVGDNHDNCGSLACHGGKSGKCIPEKGVWSQKSVTCKIKKSKSKKANPDKAKANKDVKKPGEPVNNITIQLEPYSKDSLFSPNNRSSPPPPAPAKPGVPTPNKKPPPPGWKCKCPTGGIFTPAELVGPKCPSFDCNSGKKTVQCQYGGKGPFLGKEVQCNNKVKLSFLIN